MNLKDLHQNKALSTKPLDRSVASRVTAIQLLKDSCLKEHITTLPAVLICVLGTALYEDEKGNKIIVNPGDFHPIAPKVKHWVKAIEDSQLLLFK